MPKKTPKPQHRKEAGASQIADVEPSNDPPPVPYEFPEDKKYSKRTIQNNWQKYELPIYSEQDTDNDNTSDFSFLLNHSSADSSHFQLSAEKEWESQKLKDQNSIFQLDVKLLSAGLSCIPFYERLSIDKIKLSSQDLERCDYHATHSKRQYNTLVKDIKKTREISPESDLAPSLTTKLEKQCQATEKGKNVLELATLTLEEKTISCSAGEPVPLVPEEPQTEVTGVAEAINSLQNCPVPLTENIPRAIVEDEDLEDWLDGVLDN